MTITSLPQEIRDHILDNFHSDRTTLVTCARISSSWTPRTRIHLFHEILVEGEKLRTVFQIMNSPLCTFLDSVRRVMMYDPKGDLLQSDILLSKYTTLIMHSVNGVCAYHYDGLSRLVELQLRNVVFRDSPVTTFHLLEACPLLERLVLEWQYEWKIHDPENPVLPTKSKLILSNLKSLVIHECDVGYILRYTELPQLLSIETKGMGYGAFSHVNGLFQRVKNTLEVVSIEFSGYRPDEDISKYHIFTETNRNSSHNLYF